MMQQEQFDFLASLPCPAVRGDEVAGDMIDMLLCGWAELIGDEIRLTQSGRVAIACFKAQRLTDA